MAKANETLGSTRKLAVVPLKDEDDPEKTRRCISDDTASRLTSEAAFAVERRAAGVERTVGQELVRVANEHGTPGYTYPRSDGRVLGAHGDELKIAATLMGVRRDLRQLVLQWVQGVIGEAEHQQREMEGEASALRDNILAVTLTTRSNTRVLGLTRAHKGARPAMAVSGEEGMGGWGSVDERADVAKGLRRLDKGLAIAHGADAGGHDPPADGSGSLEELFDLARGAMSQAAAVHVVDTCLQRMEWLSRQARRRPQGDVPNLFGVVATFVEDELPEAVRDYKDKFRSEKRGEEAALAAIGRGAPAKGSRVTSPQREPRAGEELKAPRAPRLTQTERKARAAQKAAAAAPGEEVAKERKPEPGAGRDVKIEAVEVTAWPAKGLEGRGEVPGNGVKISKVVDVERKGYGAIDAYELLCQQGLPGVPRWELPCGFTAMFKAGCAPKGDRKCRNCEHQKGLKFKTPVPKGVVKLVRAAASDRLKAEMK